MANTKKAVKFWRRCEGAVIMLKETDGTGIFPDCAEYRSQAREHSKLWLGMGGGLPSPETEVEIHQMNPEGGDGNARRIFSALGKDFEMLRLPVEQARNFYLEHPFKIPRGSTHALILVTKNDEPIESDFSNLLVVWIQVIDCGLDLGFTNFVDRRLIFEAEERFCLIVPKNRQ